MRQFPTGFFWGSATSAPQSEGRLPGDGKGDSIWDYWFEQNPERFFDHHSPKINSLFIQHFREDLQLLKAIGHNSLRISISWSRLIPDGTGALNPEAIKFYRTLLQTMRSLGIEPFVNLFHFDLPMALQSVGGWESRETVTAFETYATHCFTLFGDLARYWFTFNEPIVIVECGYLYQFHYPEIVDSKKAVQVGYHLALAHALATLAFKQYATGTIGIILNLSPVYAKSEDPDDQFAATIADCFFNRSFLDPVLTGTFPKPLLDILKQHHLLPMTTPSDRVAIQSAKIDFLGVNYYQPRRVQAPNTALPTMIMPETYFVPYEWSERVMNPYRGWEIFPQGLYDLAKRLQNDYGNPLWYVAENGIGVENEQRFRDDTGQIQDDYRIEFYTNHLKKLHQAISEGSNCLGYHVWTGIDNWSWLNTYKNRYGLISLDTNTQIRTVKKSGFWFKQLATTNTLPE